MEQINNENSLIITSVDTSIPENLKYSNVNCCVPNCNSTYRKTCTIAFHKFPKSNLHLHKKWILNIRTDKPISPRMVVCSKHFSQDMYFKETVDTLCGK
jgi:hypothetical protein